MRVIRDPVYERAIDLQHIDGQTGEVAERRVAGTEIIDCDMQALLAQPGKLAYAGFDVLHQEAFGDIELKCLEKVARLKYGISDDRGKVLVLELDCRDVNRNARHRTAARRPVAVVRQRL